MGTGEIDSKALWNHPVEMVHRQLYIQICSQERNLSQTDGLGNDEVLCG